MYRQKLTSILHKLNSTSPDIEASSVVSKDGIIMAAVLPTGVNEDRLGALSAAVFTVGERAAHELVQGPFDQLVIKGMTGDVLMVHAGPEAVLSIIAKSNSEMGVIYQHAKQAAAHIAQRA